MSDSWPSAGPSSNLPAHAAPASIAPVPVAPELLPNPRPRSKAAFPLTAIIATIVWLLVAVLSVLPAMMSVMIFDSPGSQSNPFTVLAFLGIASLPFLCIFTIVVVWVVYFLTRTWGQSHVGAARSIRVLTALIPLLSVGLLAVSIIGLQIACGGNFSC